MHWHCIVLLFLGADEICEKSDYCIGAVIYAPNWPILTIPVQSGLRIPIIV